MHLPPSPTPTAQGPRLPPAVCPELQPGLAQLADPHSCPHCGSSRTHGHGSFVRKDGTRQPRRLCPSCGRTFNPTTGTPLHYLKKRAQWARMIDYMGEELTLRKMAVVLDVQVATAFNWRHRLLSPLSCQPQPALPGNVTACEVYVRYSEKGRRRTSGAVARHTPASPDGAPMKRRRFRRFIDGKPSCVLFTCTGEQLAAVIVSRGRPSPQGLQACLAAVLGEGAELWANGLAPYQEACRQLGIPFRGRIVREAATTGLRGPLDAARRCGQLYVWLLQFRGVATRYLSHYLAWYRIACRSGLRDPAGASQQLAMGVKLRIRPEAGSSGNRLNGAA